jgi:hypothetical protein
MSVRSVIACAAIAMGFLMCQAALGQGMQFGAAAAPYSRPTVSPYVNLAARNQFGISNYQTLVRPMLEQQAQAAAQQQPSIRNPLPPIRLTEAQLGRRPTGQRTASRSDRYMNFSHFYGAGVTR